MTSPRVLFAGTPGFALASLKALVDSGTVPIAVLTQPDRPAGRGKKLTASPVKEYARSRGIDVLQPRTLRDDRAAEELTALHADMLVVAAYGLILPQNILDIPKLGCLNVHASVLPKWRGAAPIQAAILAGDTSTGISLMAMTAGLDCGPVFSVAETAIGADETAGELHDRLATLGGEELVAKLPAILAGDIEAAEQDDSLATYAGKITTNDAAIDWQRSPTAILRQVRAYNPVPGAWFMMNGERIKCWRAAEARARSGQPGEILTADRDGIVVACNGGAVALQELQRAGKGRVTAHEFAMQTGPAGLVLGQTG